MQLKHVDSLSPPKKFRTEPSATIFWDSEGFLMVDYLHSKKPIRPIGQYYAEIMYKLHNAIKQNRRGNCHWVFGFFTTMCQFASYLLHSKLLATVDFFNWTTLPTVQIWLLFRNLKSHFHGPGLQMMNHQKLLLKCGLKGRTDNSFFKA